MPIVNKPPRLANHCCAISQPFQGRSTHRHIPATRCQSLPFRAISSHRAAFLCRFYAHPRHSSRCHAISTRFAAIRLAAMPLQSSAVSFLRRSVLHFAWPFRCDAIRSPHGGSISLRHPSRRGLAVAYSAKYSSITSRAASQPLHTTALYPCLDKLARYHCWHSSTRPPFNRFSSMYNP